MPEGPEVRKQAEYLSDRARLGPLTEVNVLSGRYKKKPLSGLEKLREALPLKVIGGGSHGKFIYLILEDGSSIHITLGMTGGWLDEKLKHARIQLRFGEKDVYYNDTRNFGTFKLCSSRSALVEKLKSLGPDIMQKIPDDVFIKALRKKAHWNICKAMMDQKVVSGIGNYLKSEILYDCRIDPHLHVADLNDKQLIMIRDSAYRIAWASYESGGATIQSYRNPDGTTGEFSRRFAVYACDKDPLGNLVEKIKLDDGRTTHWVPAIQAANAV
jgi:DNA-formamidopyrimidine glycosylase